MVIEYFALREAVYNFEAIVENPLQIDNGEILLDQAPGVGVVYKEERVERYSR